MKVRSFGLGLDHEAEFLGLGNEGLVLGLGIGFSLVLGLVMSRPMSRPRSCKT